MTKKMGGIDQRHPRPKGREKGGKQSPNFWARNGRRDQRTTEDY